MGGRPLHLSHTSNAPGPGGICGRYRSRSVSSWRTSHSSLICLQYRSFSIISLLYLQSRRVSIPLLGRKRGNFYLHHSSFHSHLISPDDPEVSPFLLPNNNRPRTRRKFLILKHSHCQLRQGPLIEDLLSDPYVCINCKFSNGSVGQMLQPIVTACRQKNGGRILISTKEVLCSKRILKIKSLIRKGFSIDAFVKLLQQR